MVTPHTPPAGAARAVAVPLPAPPARLWTWALLGFAIGALVLFAPAPARAGVVSETAERFAGKVTDDPVAQKEIGNAVDAVVKTLPNAGEAADELAGGARTARPARGVSGPFEELVVNFDKMACAAWIVSYRDWLLGLMLKRDPATPPATLAAAQNLLNKVIYGCRKILDPESYETGVAGGGGATPAGEPDSGSATSVDVIDGELMITVSDNICWDRCRDKWMDWKGAQSMRQRAEDRLRDLRRIAETLERDTIPWLEQRLANAERRHAELLAQSPSGRAYDPAMISKVNAAQTEVTDLRSQLAAHRAEAAAARAQADALAEALQGLRDEEQARLKAYLDCLKACKAMADNAQDPSTWVDKTIEKLEPRLYVPGPPASPPQPPAEDRRTSMVPPSEPESEQVLAARLEAITALRTGEVTNSGTNVMPALDGFYREDDDQVRHEARTAMEGARHGEFGHDGGMSDSVPSAQPIMAETPPSEVSYPAEVPQGAVPHYHGDVECFEVH